jgi:hypothetical protein
LKKNSNPSQQISSNESKNKKEKVESHEDKEEKKSEVSEVNTGPNNDQEKKSKDKAKGKDKGKDKEKAPPKEKAPAASTPVASEGSDAAGDFDPSKLDFRVGLIVKCWEHAEAEKLLCEEIDIGATY